MEEIQAVTRDWAKEEPDTTAERISNEVRVIDALPVWRDMIIGARADDEEALLKTMQYILGQVVKWVLEYFDDRKHRLTYMRESRKVITSKLQYAAAIDADSQGNIIIMTSKKEDGDPAGNPTDKPGQRKLMIVKRGADGGRPDI